jgi:hypothetical protein
MYISLKLFLLFSDSFQIIILCVVDNLTCIDIQYLINHTEYTETLIFMRKPIRVKTSSS